MLAQDVRDAAALDVLHDDVVAAGRLVPARVVDLDDVGVHQLGGGQRLAPEAGDERVVLGQVLRQQLDRHLALEHLVERHEHGRHAAGAEPPVEPVAVGDLGSEQHHGANPPDPVVPPLPPLSSPPLPPSSCWPPPPVSSPDWSCSSCLLVLLVLLALALLVGLLLVGSGRASGVRRAGRPGWPRSRPSDAWHSSVTSCCKRLTPEVERVPQVRLDTVEGGDLLLEQAHLVLRRAAVAGLDCLLHLRQRGAQLGRGGGGEQLRIVRAVAAGAERAAGEHEQGRGKGQ